MTSRTLNILSAAKVQAIREAGRYSDDGGLFLYVDATRRNWIFCYTWRGGRKELGLGSARSLSLAKVREQAAEYRAMLAEGKNRRLERDRGSCLRWFCRCFYRYDVRMADDADGLCGSSKGAVSS
ncbi:hypothetical protein GGR38_004114 [Novosphingobium sediminicola]|uniref:Integrase DNA-binding domain-containing protein n=1 Tax=Novosphingobium sediminicola TaxID=563162 RepID=A0A7W6CNR3_9SPHN|nr:hypothetical protein [Novosphingobium sediminicola]